MDKLLIRALVILASVLPVQSHGASRIGFGSATFTDTTGADGCITTEVHVFARNGSFDQPDLTTQVFLKITRFNVCTETALVQIMAEGKINGTAFHINPAKQTASLDGMMTVRDDLHPGSYDLSIHVDWAGISEPIAHKAQGLFTRPGGLIRLQQSTTVLTTDAKASLHLTAGKLLNIKLDSSEAAAFYETQQ